MFYEELRLLFMEIFLSNEVSLYTVTSILYSISLRTDD